MQSFCYDLEQQLYNIINASPLSLDAKYYIVKTVFNEIAQVYEQFLKQPEVEKKIENNEEMASSSENQEHTIKDFDVQEDEEGNVTMTAEGSFIK